MTSFEQGPIRPPSEASSLLLRFTRNCPWNKCTFCPVYKGQKFSRRSIEEIKADIDTVRQTLDEFHSLSRSLGHVGQINRQVLSSVLSNPSSSASTRQIALWLAAGRGAVFIQDANSLMLPTAVLVEALSYLRATIPGVRRITSYARSSTLTRKSLDELKEISAAGLDRIHVGMESGSDAVLEFVCKGTTAAQQIDAGQKVVAAGMELSEYVMPGLGGTRLSREHAVESARVLNAINPHFIRLRSLRIPDRAPLHLELATGGFVPLGDDETVREIRLFIDNLEGIRSMFVSDHIMNLLEEVTGKLPEDKQAMLAVIDNYLDLPSGERLLFRFGRRGGALRSIQQLSDPVIRQKLQTALDELLRESGGDIEKLITELADQYI